MQIFATGPGMLVGMRLEKKAGQEKCTKKFCPDTLK